MKSLGLLLLNLIVKILFILNINNFRINNKHCKKNFKKEIKKLSIFIQL